MPADSTRQFGDSSAALQRFLSLFLRSEREVFRYVAALVPNVVDAEDIVQQTAVALWEKFDSYDPGQLGMSICPEQGRASGSKGGNAGRRCWITVWQRSWRNGARSCSLNSNSG